MSRERTDADASDVTFEASGEGIVLITSTLRLLIHGDLFDFGARMDQALVEAHLKASGDRACAKCLAGIHKGQH